jgi:hypothetical protein
MLDALDQAASGDSGQSTEGKRIEVASRRILKNQISPDAATNRKQARRESAHTA